MILRGAKFMLGCPMPPVRPLAEFFPIGEYFIMSNGIFNFNFLVLVLSEILGGPKFTLESPTPPGRPLTEKFLYPTPVLQNI